MTTVLLALLLENYVNEKYLIKWLLNFCLLQLYQSKVANRFTFRLLLSKYASLVFTPVILYSSLTDCPIKIGLKQSLWLKQPRYVDYVSKTILWIRKLARWWLSYRNHQPVDVLVSHIPLNVLLSPVTFLKSGISSVFCLDSPFIHHFYESCK